MKKTKRPKVGLALGSGGPRGLAHIGVIKVLEENNIPIDFIAGSSIGGMVGGFYAATKDAKQVEEIATGTDWKSILALIDPSFGQGLLRGKKVNNFIESHIDKVDFDDLKVPLSVVATNFKNGDAVVIDKGDVASAIRASISLPLVFAPVKRGDKLLADGGLSMPVPVEIVKKMGAELVIAVNLDADYFGDGTNKKGKFGVYRIAENSINLLRHNLAKQNVRNADIVIEPPVGNAGWKGFLDGKEIILAGEEAAKKILPQLKRMMRQKVRHGFFEKYLNFLKS